MEPVTHSKIDLLEHFKYMDTSQHPQKCIFNRVVFLGEIKIEKKYFFEIFLGAGGFCFENF